MAEAVYDASFIGYANSSLEDPTAEKLAFLRNLVTAIERVNRGHVRARTNATLNREYNQLIKEHRNDVIELFFAMLTSDNTVIVTRNLRKHELVKMAECGWPFHDRHLIAAAIDGDDVTIHITEDYLANCRAKLKRILDIKLNHVSIIV